MLLLVVGLLLFFAIHLVPTSPDLRDGLTGRFGMPAYKVAFAILSLAGLALIVMGYHKVTVVSPDKNVWFGDPPAWLTHVTWLLMLPAMIALVAAYVPSRIRSALKHPMLVAIKIWALAHLLVNWDLASFVLFGSFLAYGVYDRISVKRRGASGPLGAKTGGLIGDLVVLVVGVGLYAFMLHGGHAWLVGKSLLPA
jgi:uncharacterized membrane protein